MPLTMSDDVSIEELQKAVEHMHGVPARFVEAVEVDERHEGKPVWQGAVKVFELTGHPSGAKRAYAWSYATTGTKRRFIAILGVSPWTAPLWQYGRPFLPRFGKQSGRRTSRRVGEENAPRPCGKAFRFGRPIDRASLVGGKAN
jgi:hypothetical protein